MYLLVNMVEIIFFGPISYLINSICFADENATWIVNATASLATSNRWSHETYLHLAVACFRRPKLKSAHLQPIRPPCPSRRRRRPRRPRRVQYRQR